MFTFKPFHSTHDARVQTALDESNDLMRRTAQVLTDFQETAARLNSTLDRIDARLTILENRMDKVEADLDALRKVIR